MFIGHFGIAFAAKKIDPKLSLGTAFLAAQFIDLLWPFFLMFGIETVEIDEGNTAFTPLDFVSYPYSHSLAAVFIWAILFAVIYYLNKKNKGTALLVATLVISHWVLDLITHRPDLPLSFNENTKVGLGLWNYKAATLIVEIAIFSIGCFLYLHSTKAKNKSGRISIWIFTAFIMIIYFANAFGPAPTSADPIPFLGLAQ